MNGQRPADENGLDVHGWGIADYAAAYADGASPGDVIEAVLAGLDRLDPRVLIGAPLRDRARPMPRRWPTPTGRLARCSACPSS